MDIKLQKGSSCLAGLFLFAVTTFACDTGYAAETELATQTADGQAQVDVDYSRDPWQRLNRVMYNFNDKLDMLIVKPIATLYNKIMPRPINQGIHNVFNNIGTVPTIANDLLQLHLYQMTSDIWRLGINTTIGIGGLIDVADRMNLHLYQNDFGLTLARWGWRDSTYLVLPFWGPNTFRDAGGLPVDYYAFSIYPLIHKTSVRYELYGLGTIDRRAQLLKLQNVMEEAALDKYIFLRNAYMQHRHYQIEQNLQMGVLTP